MAHNNVCNTLHACRLKREIRSLPFEKRLEYRSELESSKKFVRHELMDSDLDLRGITLSNPMSAVRSFHRLPRGKDPPREVSFLSAWVRETWVWPAMPYS
jgi:hypothetical protein